ncbi:MAG: hypothetical protein ACK55Z_15880, partial [bacterium]
VSALCIQGHYKCDFSGFLPQRRAPQHEKRRDRGWTFLHIIASTGPATSVMRSQLGLYKLPHPVATRRGVLL